MEKAHRTWPSSSDQAQQAPIESTSINNTFWRRILTRFAVKIVTQRGLRHLFKHPGGVLFVSNFCIKAGPFTTLAEANAMRFVTQHTSIPVPTVYCAFTHKGRTYIVMKRIRGQMIAMKWAFRSKESKAKILNQLEKMIEELRSIPPPRDIGVANVDGGAIYDCRLPKTALWGPFKTIHDFHKHLRNGVDAHHLNAAPDIQELIAFHERPWSPPVFTHADLSSFNVLAHGNEVVGIVDWETAGWFPAYWEYTTAWHVNPQNAFWQQEVDKFLNPMPHELEMENIRRKYFGDY